LKIEILDKKFVLIIVANSLVGSSYLLGWLHTLGSVYVQDNIKIDMTLG
jgi:hypothetical protein